MRKIFTFLLLISFVTISFAQEEKAPEVPKGPWKPSGTLGINLSQISFTNWSKGGDNSLSWNNLLNMGLKYKQEDWTWVNGLKLAYGRMKVGERGYRTTDNDLYFESVLSKNIGWAVDPYVALTVRTVVANGFNYTDSTESQISAFFDPGYLTEAVGFTYNRSENFTSRLGIAIEQTLTDKYRQYSDDPDTPNEIEKFKMETGIESVTEAKYTLDDNLLLTTKLRLFSAFDNLDVWDVIFDNTITAKINSYLNVNLNVLMVYDADETLKTQLKQALQIGVTFNLF